MLRLNQRLWALALSLGIATASIDAAQDGPDFIEPDSNILFLGDSITQNGTYVAYLQTYLWLRYPDRNYTIINLGLSSETASGLSEPDHPFPRPHIHNRLENALAEAKPRLTFICYGMNDGIYHPPSDERFSAYVKGITRLIETVGNAGSDVILLTPPPFDAETKRLRKRSLVGADAPEYGYKTPYAHYDRVLAQFGGWILAQTGGPILQAIDIHSPLKRDIAARRARDPGYEYGDAVHPNPRGHLIIARTVLAALGYPQVEDMDAFADPPPGSALERAMPLILERNRLLSAAWREHVGHGNPRKAETPALAEAWRIAAEQETRIRKVLSER